MPQHIGIVACSAEGAALCYRTICAEGAAFMGEHDHPEVSMHTHSLSTYVRRLDDDDQEGVAELMLSSAAKLAGAGADFLICPDNTIHQAFPLVEARSPLPWLHIAEVVAEAAVRRRFRCLGLTGTRWLVDSDVYPEKLAARELDFVRPTDAEREEIQRIIMVELVHGVFRPEAVAYFQKVFGRMKDEGCDAVVLGCTEIPLIMNDDNSPLPTLDSTRLLARAALRRAVSGAESESDHRGSAGVVRISWRDLENAFMWVSSAPMYSSEAYIDRETGKTYVRSDFDDFCDEDEEIPEDLGESDRYIAIPHKNELDLGKQLALDFTAAELPHRFDDVVRYFRRRGAYARFKDMLENEGRLDEWYRFENEVTERALREWCEENDIEIMND